MTCAHIRLIRALTALADGQAVLIADHGVDWASATFAGMRHRLAFLLPDAGSAGRLVDALPDHEFTIPGHIVADIAPDDMIATAMGVVVTIDALTVEEAVTWH